MLGGNSFPYVLPVLGSLESVQVSVLGLSPRLNLRVSGQALLYTPNEALIEAFYFVIFPRDGGFFILLG